MANTANGFIRLHRKITQWEWYQNPNTFRVFLHCLLMANFTDGRFEGNEVKRGQFVTSLPSLSEQTSLSIRQVRTSLDHLILTGELTSKSYPKYRIITVVKYNDYQSDDRQIDSQMTGNRQASDRQVTGNRQQYKNENKERREEGKEKTPSVFMPPTLDEVTDYCRERGNRVDPEKWFDFYASKGWMIGKNKMKDWKAAVRTWEKDSGGSQPVRKAPAAPAQKYEQRSYASEQDEAMDRMMNSDWGSW